MKKDRRTSWKDTVPPELVEESTFTRKGGHIPFWQSLVGKLPCEHLARLRSLVFFLVKPEGVAAGKLPGILRFLENLGLRLVYLHIVNRTEPIQFENLYKYAVTRHNIPERKQICYWWHHYQVLGSGPVAVLLITDRDSGSNSVSLHKRVSLIKGPSNPHRGQLGELRYEFRTCNVAVSLVHSADDPLSTAREFLIFQPLLELEKALRELTSQSESDRRARHESLISGHVATQLCALNPGRVNLDFLHVLTRVKARLRDVLHPALSELKLIPQLDDVYRRYEFIDKSDLPFHHAEESFREVFAEEHSLLSKAIGSARHTLIRCFVELSDFDSLDFELAHRCVQLFRSNNIRITEWEAVILETSMYYRGR